MSSVVGCFMRVAPGGGPVEADDDFPGVFSHGDFTADCKTEFLQVNAGETDLGGLDVAVGAGEPFARDG
jgi:hypothetical protein